MKILLDKFNDVIPLETLKIGTLNFYPIKFNFKEIPDNLKSLDQLFDEKKVKVNEINFDGSVGNIEVFNESYSFLYILDGEAITGAKQNRIAERSVIIAPFSSNVIPVNCVEKGRWNYGNNQNFSKSDFVLHPKARAEKAQLLKRNEEYKVQDAVWNQIDELSEKHQVFNHTSDLGDILNETDRRRDFDYFDKIINLDINGYILEGAGRTFIEVFFDTLACKSNVRKSLKSWIADSDEQIKKTNLNVRKVINQFLNSTWDQEKSISIEKTFSSETKHNGRSFCFYNNLIHSYYYI